MKKVILLAGILMLLSACAENKSSDTGSSYQVTGKVIYTADNFKSAKVCVDANNNGLADDTYCTETANDGSYSFTSSDSISSYPLAASITTANTAVNARLNNGKILMYAPKGKADVISIETTLIKSIMEQNSAKTYDKADAEVAAIMKKTDNKTLLTVYTNALNSADIQNWETSIRGIVGAVTNKLLESTEITADTIITVTQEEVDNINNIIKEEDNKEPQQPENPGTEPTTPLEKVTIMLKNAEIKNSAENPVNLNEHVDPANNNVYPNGIVTRLAIKNDTFGDFLNINLTRNFTGYDSFLERYGYKEENFPSNSELGFEVTHAGSPLNYYEFSNYPYKRSQQPTGMIDEDNICIAGNVSGIFYKSIMDEDILRNEFIPKMEACNNSTDCFTDLLYVYYKNNMFKLEKWYWTIDTTQLNECKQSTTPLEKVTEMLAGAEIKNSAENPVNLNEHLDRTLIHHNQSNQITNFIGIKYDTFGEFSKLGTFTNTGTLLMDLNYKENNWPSDSPLHFEVFPDSNSSITGQNGYFFSNHYYKYHQYNNNSNNFIADSICLANGKVNGIYYKPLLSDTVNAVMESYFMQCLQNSDVNPDESAQISQEAKCLVDTWYYYKDSIKLEKWYWTIDTSLLEECKK